MRSGPLSDSARSRTWVGAPVRRATLVTVDHLRARAVPLLLATALAGSALAGCSAGVAPSGGEQPDAPASAVMIVVRGDAVTGDTGVVEVAVGERVAVTVTSDVADEVHVHGPGDGASADVGAGGTVTVDVVQTAPGEYEVELEQAQRLLTRLRVR